MSSLILRSRVPKKEVIGNSNGAGTDGAADSVSAGGACVKSYWSKSSKSARVSGQTLLPSLFTHSVYRYTLRRMRYE